MSGDGSMLGVGGLSPVAGGSSTLGASKVGVRQQIRLLESLAEQTSAGLGEAVDSQAADKQELKELIAAMEGRLMGEIGKLREETSNQMRVLRQGIDQVRKTLATHKDESTVQGEQLRAEKARTDAIDDQLQKFIREFEGTAEMDDANFLESGTSLRLGGTAEAKD